MEGTTLWHLPGGSRKKNKTSAAEEEEHCVTLSPLFIYLRRIAASVQRPIT